MKALLSQKEGGKHFSRDCSNLQFDDAFDCGCEKLILCCLKDYKIGWNYFIGINRKVDKYIKLD